MQYHERCMKLYYLYHENRKTEISPSKTYLLGRGDDCAIRIMDRTVSRVHALLCGTPEGFVLTDQGSTNGTWIDGERIEKRLLGEQAGFRLGSANLKIVIKEATDIQDGEPSADDTMAFEQKISTLIAGAAGSPLEEKLLELKQFYNTKKEGLAALAWKDQLTGVYNRRYFDRRLAEEWDRAHRYDRPLALIMIDIDHFKKYNDTWGHQKGDEVLRAVAMLLASTCRASDILCRYGGEELVFILPETPAEKAILMARHCCDRVADNSARVAGERVTVSLGVAGIPPDCATAAELVSRADRALYRAKEAGRNRVEEG